MGTSASLRVLGGGLMALPAVVDLTSTASGVWTDTGIQFGLPTAGTWHIDANVRGVLTVSDGTNAWIGARLWDVSLNALVPNSEVLVHQIATTVSTATPVITESKNQNAPIMVRYTIQGARTVRLQVVRHYTGPAPAVSRVQSDVNGRTLVRWERVE